MSRRTWFKDSAATSPGMVYVNFGFLTIAATSTDIDYTTAFGLGGLTGTDLVAGQSGSSPSAIRSIRRTANAGEYLITMQDGYRKVWGLDGSLLAPVAGPADGAWVQPSVPSNEGAGHETPVTFLVTTLNSANAPTNFAGRLVLIGMALKDLGVGS